MMDTNAEIYEYLRECVPYRLYPARLRRLSLFFLCSVC